MKTVPTCFHCALHLHLAGLAACTLLIIACMYRVAMVTLLCS